MKLYNASTRLHGALALLLICMMLPLKAGAFTKETAHIGTRLVPGGMDVTVITPDSKVPGKRYPTVYLLNGYDGDHTVWSGKTQPALGELADRYGMVMVMPDGKDSWYWDAPADPSMKMETFITTALVPWIDSRYPTISDAAHRAITGLSMGGHGALWLAMRHPDIFGNAGSTSGGVDIRPFPDSWKMKKWLGEKSRYPQRWEEHTVINLVPSLKPGKVNIIFDCGADDFFAGVNDALHRALLDKGIPHDYISRPGKHTHDYWRNAILYHLLYFSTKFPE